MWANQVNESLWITALRVLLKLLGNMFCSTSIIAQQVEYKPEVFKDLLCFFFRRAFLRMKPIEEWLHERRVKRDSSLLGPFKCLDSACPEVHYLDILIMWDNSVFFHLKYFEWCFCTCRQNMSDLYTLYEEAKTQESNVIFFSFTTLGHNLKLNHSNLELFAVHTLPLWKGAVTLPIWEADNFPSCYMFILNSLSISTFLCHIQNEVPNFTCS